jgi:hypothetical protein
MQELNIQFVNRGYGTNDGVKTVELIELGICEFSGRPTAKIASPYFPGDTLVAQFEGNGWVCDLD